ncbi:MAG: hydantoinase/oxoprolinase family protein [Rhizobiales bacterium]|nr:hydantoinase/oxoprolinase family protein [Hyphomicrobiales bacterium]MBO6698850.1 hydantoinase/oxoprolinase family protein [Hyphomicrobiales bacterium]MBO6734897.1 hydantoinase/oxoprolinase family protein [Hyphomicrobiales bacterium]MBO6911297.1 hydantoinase/oxoprolinase family protein [Hyphomicrobiales bacterium]MBO6956205.1 hydantoinase/oxoprolinase family protein [Hyphomicrobiales bacterium]
MSIVGVDVGGTFTDIFILDEATGKAGVAKVPTTRPDQSGGFLAGVKSAGVDLSAMRTVVHGTTAGTNALLERKGAKIGLITTQGFRDTLEMRRRDRRATWGLRGDFEPVVPRDRRLEVPERTLADGSVETPVDIVAVESAARELLAMGCQAVALIFINAYANPDNEQAAAQALRAVWPNPHVSVSSEILPEIREFERTSTTVLNAYLQPEVAGYLGRLESGLRDGGFGGEFLLVQSNGGVMAVETACRLPVRTALSGPAAGVIAAAYIASSAGYDNIITGDVGGTSFDVSLIANGQSALAAQTSIDFGMVVRTPMIEITTIGAGGGSIAWVDKGGLLNIGPESAGSNPGPVAYGRGNDRPTVTDANIVLGRIDAEKPIGGGLERLDMEAARTAIDTYVGAPLGLETEDAAEAILKVANARMAGAIRLVSIERGHDPQTFSFMPFGGGGALHACALVEECELARALVPRFPGVTSALGCVIADMRQDFVQTINTTLAALDEVELSAMIQAHVDEGMALLDASGVQFGARDVQVELDMAYAGQTHTVAVPITVEMTGLRVIAPTSDAIKGAFENAYRAAFSRLLEGGVQRILNLRTSTIGRRPKFDLSSLAPDEANATSTPYGSRSVRMNGAWHDTALYDRLTLPVGTVIDGPAILTQPDTTILVEPGFKGRADSFGNLILERQAAS